jgi:hypothetical protein
MADHGPRPVGEVDRLQGLLRTLLGDEANLVAGGSPPTTVTLKFTSASARYPAAPEGDRSPADPAPTET